jgi:FdhD protein
MFKRSVNILKIEKSEKKETKDIVLLESAIDIIVNSESLANIICLPKDLKELAVGFLFSLGIIKSIEDIKNIKLDEIENRINIDLNDSINFKVKDFEMSPVSRVIDTTCGISSPWRDLIQKNVINNSQEPVKLKDDLKVGTKIIYNSVKQIQTGMSLYRETGGCHGAGIFDLNGNLLGIKEDIGRHNAIDKVIGEMILKRHDFNNVFLTSSGRLTGDSVLKAVRAKIPIVASPSAAIESGIRLAFAYGITLIGFVRGSRMNIYTHSNRIIV